MPQLRGYAGRFRLNPELFVIKAVTHNKFSVSNTKFFFLPLHFPTIFSLETADLVTFTEEILGGKLNFMCTVSKLYRLQ